MQKGTVSALLLTGFLLAPAARPETGVTQNLRLEGCEQSGSHACAAITRWRAAADSRKTLRLVAELTNNDNLSSDYFVLTASDFLVAPRSGFSAADFERLKTGNEVAWGQLTTEDDMGARVVHDLKRGATRRLPLREFTPAVLIRKSFSEEDGLWPWLIRFRAIVLDRQGNTVATSSAILELEPEGSSPQ